MSTDFEDLFPVGTRVRKVRGYPWDGTVQAVFTNRMGQTRIVVELERGIDGDALHIFSPQDIRRRPVKPCSYVGFHEPHGDCPGKQPPDVS